MPIPDRLVAEIRDGNCVAFVGAGFSALAVPPWGELLRRLADVSDVDTEIEQRVNRLAMSAESKDLEAAAQTLRDALGPVEFESALRVSLGPLDLDDRMAKRVAHLEGIPFRAILTTNFDGILSGEPPGREAYLDVLRPADRGLWSERFWHPTRRGAGVVQLHGSIDENEHLVFTRQDYRRRLYSAPGYLTFLRAVMATTTVVYLGFSFTDAYLDELRSEILALIDYHGTDDPIAFAVLSDVNEDEIRYARDHEGIEVIPYSRENGYSEFDDILEEIHDRTNPKLALGSLLEDCRIVWLDPSPRDNDDGLEFLLTASEGAGANTTVDQFTDTEDALESIAALGADLVITHWGHSLGPAGGSTAEHMLSQLRERDLRAPTVVFASGSHADQNKRAAMNLGATSYEFTWDGLFREIERIRTPGQRS